MNGGLSYVAGWSELIEKVPLSVGVWKVARSKTDESDPQSRRYLYGELSLPSNLVPSFTFGPIEVKVSIISNEVYQSTIFNHWPENLLILVCRRSPSFQRRWFHPKVPDSARSHRSKYRTRTRRWAKTNSVSATRIHQRQRQRS